MMRKNPMIWPNQQTLDFDVICDSRTNQIESQKCQPGELKLTEKVTSLVECSLMYWTLNKAKNSRVYNNPI